MAAKPAKKPAPKKAEPKKAEAKKPAPKKPAEVEKKIEKKIPTSKTYHISKHPSGKWQVKFAGGEKAIKLFATQAEAIEFAKKTAGNQDGSIRVHSKKGKIRKA